MNMPSTVALPIHPASGPVANLVASMSDQRSSTIRSITSKKYPAGDQRDDFDVQRRNFALSSDVPTKPSMV